MIATILTSTDEAFMLLCMRVYYEINGDIPFEEDDEIIVRRPN